MDPWEQLIKTINGTVYDPRTKTPIHIDNQNLAVAELQKRESPEAINRYIEMLRQNSGGLPVTGQFDPETRAIDVTINPWATHEDYRQTLAHEKMHQAMDVAAPGKTMAPYPVGRQPINVVADYLGRLLNFNTDYAPGTTETQPRENVFGKRWDLLGLVEREPVPDILYPQAKTEASRKLAASAKFDESKAVGYTPIEYPTYMMATPNLLPGVTPAQSDEYTKRYVRQLPVKVGKRVVDIRNQMGAPKPKTISDLIPSGKK